MIMASTVVMPEWCVDNWDTMWTNMGLVSYVIYNDEPKSLLNLQIHPDTMLIMDKVVDPFGWMICCVLVLNKGCWIVLLDPLVVIIVDMVMMLE